MVITKKEAQRFLENFEYGDILAISNLKRKLVSTDKETLILKMYLGALEKLNNIMTYMEDETISWNGDFEELYRNAMSLLCSRCEQILKED